MGAKFAETHLLVPGRYASEGDGLMASFRLANLTGMY